VRVGGLNIRKEIIQDRKGSRISPDSTPHLKKKERCWGTTIEDPRSRGKLQRGEEEQGAKFLALLKRKSKGRHMAGRCSAG